MTDSAAHSVHAAFPLQRAEKRLHNESFDLLVVGGGIYGAWIACDAARRGLSTALVEARDWAAGTSSSSSKLIHGGLRYLEQFELGLVHESLRERRYLSRIAPHRVRPLRFLLPVWGGGILDRARLALGLGLYDTLAGFGQPVHRHRRLSATRLQSEFPWLKQDGLNAGFDYGDCQEDDARLTLDVVAAAQAAGAACANHMAAETLLEDGPRIVGARLHDRASGTHFELHCKAVVTATGPWSGHFAYKNRGEIERVRGAHLILPAIPNCGHAFILSAPQDGRAFFVIPWYQRSLVGTTESSVEAAGYEDVSGDTTADTASPAERDYLLSAVAARMPALQWSAQEVIGSFTGVRSLRRSSTASLSEVSREFELLTPRPGLWLPLGGKFTTARAEAERVVDSVCATTGVSTRSCTTATTPLPGAPTEAFEPWCKAQLMALRQQLPKLDLDPVVLSSLLCRYGTRVTQIVGLLAADPRLAKRLDPELAFIGAEIVLAKRDEMALDLDDILRRRVPLKILARPGSWALQARVLAGVQGNAE